MPQFCQIIFKTKNMYTNKIAAKIFGISFLIGYLSYGLGFGFLNVLLNAPNALTQIYNVKNQVIFEAAIMMAVFAPVNIILGVIMTPIFKPYNAPLAYGYLSAAIASSILLIVGAIFLLLSIPLSEAYMNGNLNDAKQLNLLFSLCKTANFYAYQIAMVIWGFGGLIFAYLLFVSKLLPQWLSIWGIVGYIIFISGAFFALFGIHIDVILDIPGGLFEIFLSVWLIVKGFSMTKPQAID